MDAQTGLYKPDLASIKLETQNYKSMVMKRNK